MPGVRSVLQRFQRLRGQVSAVAEASVEAKKEALLEAQKAQLYSGTTSSGGVLRSYRNKYYARKKNRMNPLPGLGNPDLYLTGAFYRGFTAAIGSGRIKLYSTDTKAQLLDASYDKNKIFGLNDQEMSDFIASDLRPEFYQQITEQLKK